MKTHIKKNIALSLMASLLVFNSCNKKESLPVPEYIPGQADGNGTGDGTGGSGTSSTTLYTETGTNPPYSTLKLTPKTASVDGSTINVNNALVEVGYGATPMSQNINIHTLTDTYISATDAPKFKRWWQVDGNTQIFRLFEGENSIIDKRGEHPRIEAFSGISWTYNPNVWHTFYAHYTLVKTDPKGVVIFQDKNSDNDWAFQLTTSSTGNVALDDRTLPASETIIVLRNMVGKSFDCKVRDNGKDWECYINDALVATGSFNRPTGNNKFRWGMYASHTQVVNSMIFVSGARFD
ncbi:hypothetical protein I5M32_12630 [Pedobacter sp. SD-b]|uniref:Polysaccharide lyase n=1 Tax=Pedobacter segetis TaxID=2793069 RepID=A0ABS1BLN0_9SPHI|nr:hypothetical protein [Pedobacter segetis]MBK0383807.1 hypothetical protein [Pedobacter segetis]